MASVVETPESGEIGQPPCDDRLRLSRWRRAPAANARFAPHYLLLVGPVALLGVGAFVARAFAWPAPGPGLGLVNLLAYRGAEGVAVALAPVAVLVALVALAWLLTRPWPALARAAIASLVGIVLAPSLSAEAVATPIMFLTLAAVVPVAGGNGQRTTDDG